MLHSTSLKLVVQNIDVQVTQNMHGPILYVQYSAEESRNQCRTFM